MYLWVVLCPFLSRLLDDGGRTRGNFTTRRCSKRKEGVRSGERAPLLVFLQLDYVGEIASRLVCCVRQFDADARLNDGQVEQKCLALEGACPKAVGTQISTLLSSTRRIYHLQPSSA